MTAGTIPACKKRQIAAGVAFIVLGLIGIVESLLMTPIYHDNLDRLEYYEHTQSYSSRLERLDWERHVIEMGPLIGVPVMIFGMVVVILSLGDKSRLDGAAFHRIRIRVRDGDHSRRDVS